MSTSKQTAAQSRACLPTVVGLIFGILHYSIGCNSYEPERDSGVQSLASAATATSCPTDVESPLSCPDFTPTSQGDCNQSKSGFLWTNGYIPFKINDRIGDAGQFSAAYEQTIRNVASAWTLATDGVVTFAECDCNGCPSCASRHLVISPGGNGGISNSATNGPQYMTLVPNQAETHQIAHELGHAMYLAHEFERSDRDRYVRLSEGYWCGGGYPQKCGVLATANPADPPLQTGSFGVFDSLSKMNYFRSGDICENDSVEPDPLSGTPTAANGSAAQELYRTAQGWAPFQPLGKDISPSAPLDYQLKPGVQISGGPALDTWGGGALDIFVRGTDGHIYHKYKNIVAGNFVNWSDWNEWTVSPTTFTSEPAAVAWAAGRNDVVARGADNNIYLRSFNGSWTSWNSLGAPTGGAMSAPAISSWGPGRLDVFVRGTDGGLYHKTCSDTTKSCGASSAAWSSWSRRGTGTFSGNPAVVSWGVNKIDIFVHGLDHKLWSIWYDQRGWGDFYLLDFGTLYSGSSPAVASWGANRLDLFVRGTDSRLWHMAWDGSVWSGFSALGGILNGNPAAVSKLGEQRIDIAAPSVDHGVSGVWWKYWPLSMK
ncbi:M12 family metallopeptidase [Sorangium sp. So ce260]|uniref:M12 family metallopeptidase n=1 Tax=Sorangium sp. So ce260 TaxID=3133291 RepID=UPI003F637A4B